MKKKTAKSRVVAKHPHHAKQTSAAHLQSEINSLKRAVSSLKHHGTTKKHHAPPKKHHKPAAKKRGLALGDMAACCAAEALAASLRQAGRPVADEDVLALYARTAADLDAGASILETLEAAWLYGLGGVRPVDYRHYRPAECGGDLLDRGGEIGCAIDSFLPCPATDCQIAHDHAPCAVIHAAQPSGLILGLELPGPHTVLATPEGWWSWGELLGPAEFPDAVIEEAWAVSWR